MSQDITTTKKPRKKLTYIPAPLPPEGVVRKPSVLAVLGISSNALDNGIKKGLYPPGTLLSPRCRVWPVTELRAFLAALEGGSQP
ncbi:MAG: hypothetical protein WCP01_14805 [Methylococcaceae bacterium]